MKKKNIDEINSKKLLRKLIDLGLKKKDIVFVSANFSRLSINFPRFIEIFFKDLSNFLSTEGTLVSQCYTTYTARHGVKYVHERSSPINGALSKFFFYSKKKVRSFHPVNSFIAIGKHSNKICSNNSCNNFGIDSPLDRVLKLKGKVLRIGIKSGDSPYMHYAETLFGVPYTYNKLLNIKVVKFNKIIKRNFVSNVRYLVNVKNVIYNVNKLNRLFKKKFRKCITYYLNEEISLINSNNIVNYYFEMLRKNIWSFLKKKPSFKKGIIPFDGFTCVNDNY